MFRFILYGITIYLIYDFFLKPLFRITSSNKTRNRPHSRQEGQIRVDNEPPKQKSDFTEGEYIDYEDLD